MLPGHGVSWDSGTAKRQTVPLGVMHWRSLGLEHACTGRCGAGGGGDGEGGGGGTGMGGTGIGVVVAQMVKPARVTEASLDQVNDSPAVISTLAGPVVPLYWVLPSVM